MTDPSEVVQVGERVKGRVVGIDPERRRPSLSIRQAAADRYRPQTAIAAVRRRGCAVSPLYDVNKMLVSRGRVGKGL